MAKESELQREELEDELRRTVHCLLAGLDYWTDRELEFFYERLFGQSLKVGARKRMTEEDDKGKRTSKTK